MKIDRQLPAKHSINMDDIFAQNNSSSAMRVVACQGQAGATWQCVAGCGEAWQSMAWQSMAWRGQVWRGVAKYGVARRGAAWHGTARRGAVRRDMEGRGVA